MPSRLVPCGALARRAAGSFFCQDPALLEEILSRYEAGSNPRNLGLVLGLNTCGTQSMLGERGVLLTLAGRDYAKPLKSTASQSCSRP